MKTQFHFSGGVRPCAVAGYFYPGKAAMLIRALDSYIDFSCPDSPAPKVIIAPHARYVYSGPIAGNAYRHLQSIAAKIRRVVLLGPAHRVYANKMTLCSATELSTPLGNIRIDTEAEELILQHPSVIIMDAAHYQEHSLEVHLPFLQKLLHDFLLVPVLVGDVPFEEVANILEQLWGGDETLIVISSDLSHYHAYNIAKEIDHNTAQAIAAFDHRRIGPEQCCGYRALNGLLSLTKEKSMQIVNYDLRNSGDTSGDRDRVVGYAAWGIY